jgi:hypothetical protein
MLQVGATGIEEEEEEEEEELSAFARPVARATWR